MGWPDLSVAFIKRGIYLYFSAAVGAVDIMVPPDPAAIQEAIETHAVAACTNAAWLQVKGKLVSATSE